MSEKVVKNWLALAEYDFETAKAMLSTGRYVYVAFTCQQCIEKTLKAIYVRQRQLAPPYIHSLTKLATLMSFFEAFSQEQLNDLELLNSYYLQSRYSEQIDEMRHQFTEQKAIAFIQKTEELLKWLKNKL